MGYRVVWRNISQSAVDTYTVHVSVNLLVLFYLRISAVPLEKVSKVCVIISQSKTGEDSLV